MLMVLPKCETVRDRTRAARGRVRSGETRMDLERVEAVGKVAARRSGRFAELDDWKLAVTADVADHERELAARPAQRRCASPGITKRVALLGSRSAIERKAQAWLDEGAEHRRCCSKQALTRRAALEGSVTSRVQISSPAPKV